MLNDLEISLLEIIILENSKQTADRITDLEDLDGDHWSAVAHLCNKYEKLEQKFKELEKRNMNLEEKMKNLTEKFFKLNDKFNKL